ncbi:MAG: cell envelope integrity protein CreD [Piscinibacter sp.]|nr:cell envelope integrity protein CreD [Piscinibacter sp.]
MRHPLIAKGLSLALVLLGLLWALASVRDIVAEREGRLHEAQRSVAASLAGGQTLVGPLLRRQCTEQWREEQGEGKERRWVEQQREIVLAAVPTNLALDARAQIEPRYRGIFRVNGYAMQATLAADWADLHALQPPAPRAGVDQRCGTPLLWVGVTDARGLRSAAVALDGTPLTVRPGTPATGVPRGFQADWPAARPFDPAAALQARVVLELIGSEGLAFAPVGEQARFRLASDWPHPSFNGLFLPARREVGPDGFEAEWRVSALASRAGPQVLEGHALCAPEGTSAGTFGSPQAPAACVEQFGVAFIDPVSGYVLSDRATKYGLLFIVLSFVAVGLVEVLRALRVHPVQYALVGSALALFFLLLVSLAEHLAFGPAYAVASLACTLLLTYYATHVLQGWRAGAAFGAGMAALYGLLYLLLRSEQSALLLGSMLLFAVLAAVMVATRRIDWYALAARWRAQAGTRGGTPQAELPL